MTTGSDGVAKTRRRSGSAKLGGDKLTISPRANALRIEVRDCTLMVGAEPSDAGGAASNTGHTVFHTVPASVAVAGARSSGKCGLIRWGKGLRFARCKTDPQPDGERENKYKPKESCDRHCWTHIGLH